MMTSMTDCARRYGSLLREVAPALLANRGVSDEVTKRATLILHGSTTHGVDDDHSDIDVWLLLSDEDLAHVDHVAGSRFLEFSLQSKAGHFNAESIARYFERVHNLIWN